MKFFLLFVALSFLYLSLCGAEAVASSDPNVDYILKGRSERIATYMKCSLSNEYCMCVEQVVRKGGEVFRCSVFLQLFPTNMRCLLNDVKCVMEGRTAESRGNCSQ